MSLALAQYKNNWGSTGAAMTATFDSTPTAGRLIVALCDWQNTSTRAVSGITDNAGNTYHALTKQHSTTVQWSAQIWYAYDVAVVPSHTVTGTFSGSGGGWCQITIAEFSGLVGTGDPFDDECGTAVNSLSAPDYDLPVGTLTPTQTAGIVVVAGKYSTGTAPDSYPAGTIEFDVVSYATHRYAILASGSPYAVDFSFGQSSAVACVAALFKGNAEIWVPVRDWVEQEIPSSAFPGGVARILGDLWSEDTGGSPLPTIQARLYNLTDAVSVGESAALQSSDYPSACDFSVTLTPGTKRYRAEVTSDPPEVDIFFSSRGVGP
jgi:hypothetical protein